MSDYSVAAENAALDAITVDTVSLHTGDPGTNGTSNEVTGGSPAYARKSITVSAASGGQRLASTQPEFDVPGGVTVAYVGLWQGATFKGAKAVANKTDSAQWIYRLTSLTLDIT